MRNVFLFLFSIVAGALLAVGCASSLAGRAANSLRVAGNDADQVSAYVKSADSAVKSAAAHADAAGKALLDHAATDHKAALDQLAIVRSDIASAQSSVKSLGDENESLRKANYDLTHSWGHKLQVFVGAFLTLILILVAVHYVGIVLAIFLPTPYGTIAGYAAKIVNPLAWGVWLLAYFEQKVSVNVALKAAVGPSPAGTPANPIHAIIDPPITPKAA